MGYFNAGILSRTIILAVVIAGMVGVCPTQALFAQDLAPRAYVVGPIHINAVTLTYTSLDGGVLFNNVLPITDSNATIHVSAVTFYHSMDIFGRSANFTASLPYGVGNFEGTYIDNTKKQYHSGLLDPIFRFSINLAGGPAMTVEEYKSWRQKTILGASLKVVVPLGQYDGSKFINNGTNRWTFKPQLGYSRRLGHWVIDGYGAVWFFTTNKEFFSHNAIVPGDQSLSQQPIGDFETHLSYNVTPRLWVSLDGSVWFGGSTSLNGVRTPGTGQLSSLIGATFSFPRGKHQSIKISYDDTDYVKFGGSYQRVSVGWQYTWLGRPK